MKMFVKANLALQHYTACFEEYLFGLKVVFNLKFDSTLKNKQLIRTVAWCQGRIPSKIS